MSATDAAAPPSFSSRSAAIAALAVGLASLVVAGGMWPDNLEWAPAFVGLAALYGVTAAGLWSGRRWGRFLGLGLGLWGLTCFVESAVVVGMHGWLGLGLGLHVLLLAGAAFGRSSGVDRRHGFAMTMAGAALPCALIYGLAPQSELLVAAGVLGGAATLVAATAGLGRGKSWGLLAALAGAGAIAATTAAAPALGWLAHPHPILPNENPLALFGLGVAASTLAVLAVVPYLGPIARFLFAGPSR